MRGRFLPTVIRPSDCKRSFGELPLAKQAVFAMYCVRRMLRVSPQYSGLMSKVWLDRVNRDVRRDITLRILEAVANDDQAVFNLVLNLHNNFGLRPEEPYVFTNPNNEHQYKDTMRLGWEVERAWVMKCSESNVLDRAAALIQQHWRYAIACPRMLLCINRLKREMHDDA